MPACFQTSHLLALAFLITTLAACAGSPEKPWTRETGTALDQKSKIQRQRNRGKINSVDCGVPYFQGMARWPFVFVDVS